MGWAAGEPFNGWHGAGSYNLTWPNSWSQAASEDLTCGSLFPPAPGAIKLRSAPGLCSLSLSLCLSLSCLELSRSWSWHALKLVTLELFWSWLSHAFSHSLSSASHFSSLSVLVITHTHSFLPWSWTLHHPRFFPGPGHFGSCSQWCSWTLGCGEQYRDHSGEWYQAGEGDGDAHTGRLRPPCLSNLSPHVCVVLWVPCFVIWCERHRLS